MQHTRTKNALKFPLILSVPLNTLRYSLTAYILYHIGLTSYNVTTAVAASCQPYASSVSATKNPLIQSSLPLCDCSHCPQQCPPFLLPLQLNT